MNEKNQLPAGHDVPSDLNFVSEKAIGGQDDKATPNNEPVDPEGNADPNFATNGE